MRRCETLQETARDGVRRSDAFVFRSEISPTAFSDLWTSQGTSFWMRTDDLLLLDNPSRGQPKKTICLIKKIQWLGIKGIWKQHFTDEVLLYHNL